MESFGVTTIVSLAVPVSGVIGAWLHARYGRKVRIKVGDIEVEAQSQKAAERLFAKAQEIQQANQPRKIYEP
jgi:hypothetical protein